MRVSVIVPTYKDLVALKLILDAFEHQAYKNFEVIIAEDDNSQETRLFLQNSSYSFEIQHFYQEDSGNRKATILNKSLANLKTEYVIFIDGDCIPFSRFIQTHVLLAQKKVVLCGRRVNLGDRVSADLRNEKVNAYDLQKSYIGSLLYLTRDNIRHYEQGFYFHPKSFLFKLISSRDNNIHIVGSNFSCFLEDIVAINGFDEDIVGGSKDDVDLEWRFVGSGCRLKSCKFSANLFHLNHSRESRVADENIAKEQMRENQKLKKFVCANGIKK